MTAAPPFDTAVERLVNQVGHWTQARWKTRTPAGGITRADTFHALVQQLADASADAEGEPRRPVPYPDNLLALPDQLKVVAADVRAAVTRSLDPETALVRATAAAL